MYIYNSWSVVGGVLLFHFERSKLEKLPVAGLRVSFSIATSRHKRVQMADDPQHTPQTAPVASVARGTRGVGKDSRQHADVVVEQYLLRVPFVFHPLTAWGGDGERHPQPRNR